MRELIDNIFDVGVDNPSPETLKVHEQLSYFVNSFKESDEYYLLKKIVDTAFRAQSYRCQQRQVDKSEAELHLVAGMQALLNALDDIVTGYHKKMAQILEQEKEDKEQRAFVQSSGGYDEGVDVSDVSSLAT